MLGITLSASELFDDCAQVNGALVNGKSVSEIQHTLDECPNHLFLELMHCQRTMPTSSDMSHSSSFPTPSSPLTTDESSMTDISGRRKDQTRVLRTDVPDTICKSGQLMMGQLNTSEPDMISSRDSCNYLGRSKETKLNFLDKAVNAIRRPFLRSRQSRATRDARSKSAFVYVGSMTAATDDFAIGGTGRSISPAAGSQWPDLKERSLSRRKPADTGHGTWPKYRAHAAQRPSVSVLPLYANKPSSSSNDKSPSLSETVQHATEIRQSEFVQYHRPQISDSVVDYAPRVESQKNCASPEDVPESSARYNTATQFGSRYARRFPDQMNDTASTAHSANHQVTVISYFPAEHCASEMVSYGDHTKFTQRPAIHSSADSSVGKDPPEKHLFHSSDMAMSSRPHRPQQLSLARYNICST